MHWAPVRPVTVVLITLAGCFACAETGDDDYPEGMPFLPGAPLDASIPWDGFWETDSTPTTGDAAQGADLGQDMFKRDSLREIPDASDAAIDEAPISSEDATIPEEPSLVEAALPDEPAPGVLILQRGHIGAQ